MNNIFSFLSELKHLNKEKNQFVLFHWSYISDSYIDGSNILLECIRKIYNTKVYVRTENFYFSEKNLDHKLTSINENLSLVFETVQINFTEDEDDSELLLDVFSCMLILIQMIDNPGNFSFNTKGTTCLVGTISNMPRSYLFTKEGHNLSIRPIISTISTTKEYLKIKRV